MKKNILFFNESSKMGGAEHSLLVLLQNLDRAKYNPILITEDEGELTQKCQKADIAFECVTLPKLFDSNPVRQGKNILLYFSSLFKVKRLIKKYDPVLMHSNTSRMHMLIPLAGKLFGCPVVSHLRWIPIDSHLEKHLVRTFFLLLRPYIIAISHVVVDAYGIGKYHKKSVVYNGVQLPDEVLETPYDIRNKYNIDSGKKILLSIGRIEPWKGQLFLLQAFKALKENCQNTVLLVVGDDLFENGIEYKNQLLEIAKSPELEGRIIFTGHVPNPLDYIAAADIVFHTSITPEPFGRVVVEAMCLGKPTIASDIGGPTEIIEHGIDGYLCSPKDTETLLELIERLITSEEEYSRISLAAKSTGEKRFSGKAYAAQVQEIFSSVQKIT